MSQNPANKPNLMTRLEALEAQQARVPMIEQLAVNLRRSMTTVVEMLNALVEELGGKELGERIQNRLDEKRAEVRRAEAKRSAELMKRLIDEGQLETVPEIDEESIIVALESSLDGKIKDEELQMAFMQFNPDIQAELKGKQVGYVLSREGQEVLKIQGIYKMRAQAPTQLSETEQQAPASTEAPAAEAKDEVKDLTSLPSADEVATVPAAE